MNIVKGKEEELKAETETFSDELSKENKEEIKYQSEEQQRDGNGGGEANKQTRRDARML